jgi:AcrR family transcriptional regulator
MKKTDYHHGNLKDDFLKIAFDFIQENEIENLTLKILSDKTGTSRSAIYRHFKNKDALIETMILQGFDKFDEHISVVLLDTTKPLIDRFYNSGKMLIEFAIDHPNLYRLLFGKKYSHIREEVISIKDEDCSGFSALKKAIEEGQNSGILKNDDSYTQSIVIWASLHGLASLVIDGFMDIKNIYPTLYDKMFDSILSSTASKKVKIISKIPIINNMLKPKEL